MTIAFRIAAVQLALLSVGFGIAGVLGAEYFGRTGDIWGADGGFPTYDPAGFERWGFEIDVIPAILTFVATCLVGVIAALLLWVRSTAVVGSILAIVATALQAFFWIAFDLPFGPPGGVIVAALVVVGLVLRRRRRTLEAAT
jgi:MYXO-CTERM domain-containing protein